MSAWGLFFNVNGQTLKSYLQEAYTTRRLTLTGLKALISGGGKLNINPVDHFGHTPLDYANAVADLAHRICAYLESETGEDFAKIPPDLDTDAVKDLYSDELICNPEDVDKLMSIQCCWRLVHNLRTKIEEMVRVLLEAGARTRKPYDSFWVGEWHDDANNSDSRSEPSDWDDASICSTSTTHNPVPQISPHIWVKLHHHDTPQLDLNRSLSEPDVAS